MRCLLSAIVVGIALALLLPLGFLPQTETVQVIGGFTGMALGVCVLLAWGAIWL
jgi:hypothetical protein